MNLKRNGSQIDMLHAIIQSYQDLIGPLILFMDDIRLFLDGRNFISLELYIKEEELMDCTFKEMEVLLIERIIEVSSLFDSEVFYQEDYLVNKDSYPNLISQDKFYDMIIDDGLYFNEISEELKSILFSMDTKVLN